MIGEAWTTGMVLMTGTECLTSELWDTATGAAWTAWTTGAAWTIGPAWTEWTIGAAWTEWTIGAAWTEWTIGAWWTEWTTGAAWTIGACTFKTGLPWWTTELLWDTATFGTATTAGTEWIETTGVITPAAATAKRAESTT